MMDGKKKINIEDALTCSSRHTIRARVLVAARRETYNSAQINRPPGHTTDGLNFRGGRVKHFAGSCEE
jgi:hypothetical protein